MRLGIDSISLLPDAVLRTALAIVELEKKLGWSPAQGGLSAGIVFIPSSRASIVRARAS